MVRSNKQQFPRHTRQLVDLKVLLLGGGFAKGRNVRQPDTALVLPAPRTAPVPCGRLARRSARAPMALQRETTAGSQPRQRTWVGRCRPASRCRCRSTRSITLRHAGRFDERAARYQLRPGTGRRARQERIGAQRRSRRAAPAIRLSASENGDLAAFLVALSAPVVGTRQR